MICDITTAFSMWCPLGIKSEVNDKERCISTRCMMWTFDKYLKNELGELVLDDGHTTYPEAWEVIDDKLGHCGMVR